MKGSSAPRGWWCLAGRAGPGKRGNDIADGGGLWSYGSRHCRNGTERDGESVCAESAAGFGGSGAAFAGFERDGAGNFADAIEA